MTLLGFALCAVAAEISLDISCPRGAQQQTRLPRTAAAVERRERQTDGRLTVA